MKTKSILILVRANFLILLAFHFHFFPVAFAGDEEAPDPPISAKAVGAKPSPDIPGYVSSLPDLGDRYNPLAEAASFDWLLLGLQHRSRFETLDNFYRVPNLPTDEGYFARNLFYLGVREAFDPFRLTVELEDSRRGSLEFPTNLRQTNHADFLQAYIELYFEDAFAGEDASLMAGRFTIEAVDRRLIARNRFRNSANAFDGLRLKIGESDSPWAVNLFATRPVEPRRGDFDDRSRDERTFYGGYASLRGASPGFVLEPYYFYLDDERAPGTSRDRSLHTLGAHAYGLIGGGPFDYDLSAATQWGDVNGLDHSAFALHGEVGYTFDHAWKPRLAGWVNYASGDDNPADGDSGRFSQLFGVSFGAYGLTRYFSWENIINPAVYLSLRPTDSLRVESFLRSYSLASDTDAWVRTRRRDTTGASGGHLGEELDFRVRWKASDGILIDGGVARFFPGNFVDRTGLSEDSTLVYLQTTLRF